MFSELLLVQDGHPLQAESAQPVQDPFRLGRNGCDCWCDERGCRGWRSWDRGGRSEEGENQENGEEEGAGEVKFRVKLRGAAVRGEPMSRASAHGRRTIEILPPTPPLAPSQVNRFQTSTPAPATTAKTTQTLHLSRPFPLNNKPHPARAVKYATAVPGAIARR